MVKENGYILIIDFGVSKILKPGDDTCTKVGTYGYMAKEIDKGEAYDKSIDWYSVGCILYELIFGETPN